MHFFKSTYRSLQFYLLHLLCIFYIGRANSSSLQITNHVSTQNDFTNGLIYTQNVMLNSSQGFFGVLEWTVKKNESRITFVLTKRATSTKLNLVLGLSKTGDMDGADLVVITGDVEGPFKTDNMFGTNTINIQPSSREIWSLEGLEKVRDERGENLKVALSRKLNTCKLEDGPFICINDDMLHIFWGSDQQLSTETTNNSKTFIPDGSLRAFLLDPQIPPTSSNGKTNQDILSWRTARTHHISKTQQTSYWCNIRKAPTLSTPHNIIGFVPYFADIPSKNYVHHQLIYRCEAPPGMDLSKIFEPLFDFAGEECYLEDSRQIPSHLCKELVYPGNRGMNSFYFPENVGIPIGETRDEYFLLEIHYDNPSMFENITVESGIDVLYSPTIRPVHAGVLLVGVGILGLYTVPPNSVNFRVGGLCGSDCTTDMFTGKGATSILAVSLHAHMATHTIRLIHFRGDKQLSILLKDENFDSNYQQIRFLDKPIRIMPGDQFGVECVLNTGNRTTLSGFSTRNEMCFAALILDKRSEYLYCFSEYPTSKTLSRYGVQKASWDKELQERIIRTSDGNPDWVGRTLQSVLDCSPEKWTGKERRDTEREQFYGIHDSVCPPYRKLVSIFYSSNSVKNGSITLHPNDKIIMQGTQQLSTYGFLKRSTVWPHSSKTHQMNLTITSMSSKASISTGLLTNWFFGVAFFLVYFFEL